MAENVIDTLKLDIIVNTKQNGQSITTLRNSLEKLYKFLNGDVAVFLILFDFTAPATCICPPKRRSFSVKVVLPASGCEIIANVRLLSISFIILV